MTSRLLVIFHEKSRFYRQKCGDFEDMRTYFLLTLYEATFHALQLRQRNYHWKKWATGSFPKLVLSKYKIVPISKHCDFIYPDGLMTLQASRSTNISGQLDTFDHEYEN